MSIPLAIALYFVIWWTALFAILPIGLRTQGEAGDVVPGTPASAPAHFRVWWIVWVNTLVSALVFVLIYWAVEVFWNS